MKIARIKDNDTSDVRLVVMRADEPHPIRGVTGLRELIGDGCDSLAEAADMRGYDDPLTSSNFEYLSPLESTGAFRDFYAFEQHVRAGRAWRGLEMEPDWYRLPVFYFSNPYALEGSSGINIAPGAERFDFELEVGALLGRGGNNLTPAEATSLVVGYMVLNDWSARDIQKREMQLSMGPVKGKDTATSIGPFVVTPDELEDRRTTTGFDLQMSCRVNGRTYTNANWSDVYWSFPEMISYASRGTRVMPGDLFGSGTCGTGCINELSQTYSVDEYPFLKPGDVVEAEIERLGVLKNTIITGAPLRELREGLER